MLKAVDGWRLAVDGWQLTDKSTSEFQMLYALRLRFTLSQAQYLKNSESLLNRFF